ncbi:trigger factor [Candidatus Oleimmundimicrobium sp.]|uniref:trigger factor n=1 Tax=Candidatus Oleimmundimicrobium sp. TaxID=3060597 RepID=UPI00271EA397|nr:trigger factor [Candidatus Oleimmundimicrobium sp.]MDO8885874.1 trigger factor [Candidatus Oleimmundimicrobium sp.]
MKAEVEKLEKSKVLLKVEVPKEDIERAIKEAYKVISKKINVPGFRKGKVPLNIIDTRVGEEAIIDEMLRQLVPGAYTKAVEKTGIEPINIPEIDVKDAKRDKVNFHAKVDVKPKVDLADYKKLKAKRAKVKLTNEEINQQIEITRNSLAQLEVAERKIISKDDFVMINFDGLVDGKSFEGGSAKDFLLEVGSNQIVPDFDKNLFGARKGDIKEFTVDMPPKYDNQAIAGKTVKYKVLVKEIKQKVLPELNDKFAEEVGGFKTLDEYKESIRKRLEEVKTFKAEEDFRRKVLDEAAEGTKVDIPDIMVDRMVAEMVDEFLLSLQSRGVSAEDYFSVAETSIEELKKSFRERAKERTRDEIVLEAIAKKEGLTISEDELSKEVEAIAQRLNEDKEKLRKIFEERGILEKIKNDLLIRNSLERLVELTEKTTEKRKKKSEDGGKNEKSNSNSSRTNK